MHQQLTKIDNIVININQHQFLVALVCVSSLPSLRLNYKQRMENQMPWVGVIIRKNHMYL